MSRIKWAYLDSPSPLGEGREGGLNKKGRQSAILFSRVSFKLVIRIGILALVLGLLLLLIFNKRSPFGKGNSNFYSKPSVEITRIEFSDGTNRLYLEKSGGNWKVNGKTEARRSGVYFLLNVLKEMRIKSPVSAELFENEVTSKSVLPVKVKVYEKRKLLSSFLVYKTRSNVFGNIMKISERSKPFIVSLPGLEGDIGSAFTLNELYWKPYTIFNLMPSEISSVHLENLSDTSLSFSVLSKDHRFIISDDSHVLQGSDSALIARYLSYFVMIPFESWALEMGEEEKKNIEASEPLYRLTVNTMKKQKITLTLWSRTIDKNGVKSPDSDRLFGKTEEIDELFIIRYFDIDPLLKKRSYFFHM